MAVGTRIGEAVERARAIFARRPATARARKAATARLIGAGWRTEVCAGDHTFMVDQPAALGGDSDGPSPGDLIRGALAACLVQNYAMHAQRFGVALDAVEVTVESNLDLRAAWGLDVEEPPGFLSVRYTSTLTTNAPPERVRTLAEYAEQRSPSLDDLRRAIDVTGRCVIRMSGEGDPIEGPAVARLERQV
jgi:putative redox protein